MRYPELEIVITENRLGRYLDACNKDKNKALYLYRCNCYLAQELLAVLGAFEVALRNSVDRVMIDKFGRNWIHDSIQQGGIFYLEPWQNDKKYQNIKDTAENIRKACNKARCTEKKTSSNSKHLTRLSFGFWSYMYAAEQYSASKKVLLKVFPNKAKSSKDHQYNNEYIHKQLLVLLELRNRIAHLEPICFANHKVAIISTGNVKEAQKTIKKLLYWMGIDPKSYLRGLDHVREECEKIDRLAASI